MRLRPNISIETNCGVDESVKSAVIYNIMIAKVLPNNSSWTKSWWKDLTSHNFLSLTFYTALVVLGQTITHVQCLEL